MVRRFVDSNPVIVFYILAFLFAWAGWIPLIFNSRGSFLPQTPYVKALLVLPAVSPAVAALIIRRMIGREEDSGNLLRSLFQSRVNRLWFLLAAVVPATLLLCTVFLETVIST